MSNDTHQNQLYTGFLFTQLPLGQKTMMGDDAYLTSSYISV